MKEARRAAQGRPLAVQVTNVIQRSQNQLHQMEEERVVEQQELEVALACLSKLREEARNPDPPPIVVSPARTQPGVIQATDPSAEIGS